MVGFGAIGQCVLPLLLRHIDILPEQISILAADDDGKNEAFAYGVPHRVAPLLQDNFQRILDEFIEPGDFLINLSINVSSIDLIRYCQTHRALYLDACIEPWEGGYTDPSLTISARSNYGLRESARALMAPDTPTAVLTHGANPGWVSHLVKQALLDIARKNTPFLTPPSNREGWAKLAQSLSVKVIHIAERDWQVATPRKRRGEFVNTWSVSGFVDECCQPSEIGWGSHEKHFPFDGQRHGYGCEASIYLNRPGAATKVRSWTPHAGPIHGFLISHGEAISIADHFTLGHGQQPEYRPTCLYAYQPCDDAVLSLHELAAREWRQQDTSRIVRDEIIGGLDELGVLLMGHQHGAYWLGSCLSTAAARKLSSASSATSLQVAAGVLAGVVWAMKNPQQGIVGPDELPFDELMSLCSPYLGEIVGAYSDWTPLKDRQKLFAEEIDRDDPWQFINFRVC